MRSTGQALQPDASADRSPSPGRKEALGHTRAPLEIYPVCERLVGEPFFAAMAGRYASEHASTSPDLGDYGGELPAFLRAFTPNGNGCSMPPMSTAST